ncbi:MAG: hypothetical protein R3B72_32695 [Polyangiaceae bacterium]
MVGLASLVGLVAACGADDVDPGPGPGGAGGGSTTGSGSDTGGSPTTSTGVGAGASSGGAGGTGDFPPGAYELVVLDQVADPWGMELSNGHAYYTTYLGGFYDLALDGVSDPVKVHQEGGVLYDLNAYGSQFHWTRHDNPFVDGGAVQRYDATSGSVTTIATEADLTPVGVVAGASGVYWSLGSVQGGPLSIHRHTVAEGVVTLLDESAGHVDADWRLALDADHLYWADYGEEDAVPGGGVYRTDVVTGAHERFHATAKAGALVIDDSHVYFTAGCALHRKAKAAAPSDPAELVAAKTPTGCLTEVAVHGDRVYWIERRTASFGVFSAAKDGQDALLLASTFAGFGAMHDLEVDGNWVLLGHGTDRTGRILGIDLQP